MYTHIDLSPNSGMLCMPTLAPTQSFWLSHDNQVRGSLYLSYIHTLRRWACMAELRSAVLFFFSSCMIFPAIPHGARIRLERVSGRTLLLH